MHISKPKRQENGTYQASILQDKNGKRFPFVLKIKQAYIFGIKEMKRDAKTEDEPSYALLFKHHSIIDTLYDINQEVIDIVKAQCSSWFKTSLTDDMIDDYFVNNIMYDSKKGKYIKIKCINDISEVPVNVMVNLEISLQHIRFYKQQFVLEWVVDEVEIIDGSPTTEHEEEADDDIPYPTEDDIHDIKSRIRKTSQVVLEKVNAKLSMLQKYKESITNRLTEIHASQDIHRVIALCDEIDNIQDEFANLSLSSLSSLPSQ
jgi:hypothetical protein